MRVLSIDRVLFAEINLAATLLGSLFCLGVGGLIDRAGSRLVLTVLSLCLGAVVLAMSAARGVWPLLASITLTRALGQSALSVASLALVGKWFSRRLDLAMGAYEGQDRKSTRLNSSHTVISYAVFCLKKKKKQTKYTMGREIDVEIVV